MNLMNINTVITCEHAGKSIPPDFAHLFQGVDAEIESHRGWDPGALLIAKYLSDALGVPLFKCEVSRLLVETNRSLDSSSLFSEYTQALNLKEKAFVLQAYYYPYRRAVELYLRKSQPVVHWSIHSFTPVLNGDIRSTDIGILFDPSRNMEVVLSEKLSVALSGLLPGFRVAFNTPYQGTDDGFTTYLRTQFTDSQYAGIEIEINQRHLGTTAWENIEESLVSGLRQVTI